MDKEDNVNRAVNGTILIGWTSPEGGDYYPARARRMWDAVQEFRLLFGWSVDIVSIQEVAV